MEIYEGGVRVPAFIHSPAILPGNIRLNGSVRTNKF